MAFGDYATLITDFTGPDESPLSDGGNWQIINTASADLLIRKSNALTSSYPDTPSPILVSQRYWTPSKFGPDVEMYVTVKGVSNAIFLNLRLSNPGGFNTFSNYLLQIETGTWSIFAQQVGAESVIGTGTQTVSVGDKVGFRIQCFAVDGFYNNGSGWANIVTASDTGQTYPQLGYIGLGVDQHEGILDDFYAGTIPRTSPCAGDPTGLWLPKPGRVFPGTRIRTS